MDWSPKSMIYLMAGVIFLYIILLSEMYVSRNCELCTIAKSKSNIIEMENFAPHYRTYLKIFNKRYDPEETQWRFEVFKKNLKEINRLNKMGVAKYGWTKFTDVTPDELFKTGSGTKGQGKHRRIGHQHNRLCHHKNRHGHKKNRHGHKKNRQGHQKNSPMVRQQHKSVCKPRFDSSDCPDVLQRGIYKDKKIPDKVDWREKGMVGPVLNQKLCNGCWAFSIVGVMESMAVKQGLEPDIVSLSIQEVLDCRAYETGSGCNYGSVYKHLRYMWNNNISVVKETEYPLTLFEETCRLEGNPPGRQLGCFNYKTNVTDIDIQRLLAFHGPVITVVNAYPWMNYLDGVISESCYRSLNEDQKLHVVQIVGYDTTPVYPDIPYYIVRNSWGEDFGIDGYVKLAMNRDICGISDEIYYLMVK